MDGQRPAANPAAAESAVYDRVNDFSAVTIKLASPNDQLRMSCGLASLMVTAEKSFTRS